MKEDNRPRSEMIHTATGRCFWPLNPRPEEVCIEDIALSLSGLPRWLATTRRIITVAEHSVRVARLVAQRLERMESSGEGLLIIEAALMHDSAEAYTGDLPNPIKRAKDFEFFVCVEQELQRVIGLRFDLPCAYFDDDLVHWADRVLGLTEARDLKRGNTYHEIQKHHPELQPLPERIEPWSNEKALSEFCTMWQQIRRARGKDSTIELPSD